MYASVLVIEDDVMLCADAIKELIKRAKVNNRSGKFDPIISMSALPRSFFRWQTNHWRKSIYFSAWGYVIHREFWLKHQEIQIKSQNMEQILKLLQGSEIWNSLSKRKKEIWLERFLRGNYDYQIQKSMMILNRGSYAPIFRISDNEGHSNLQATHTKHKKPAYLKFKIACRNMKFDGEENEIRQRQRISRLLDSNTWAGDGMLSERGRVWGVRTTIKWILNGFTLDIKKGTK